MARPILKLSPPISVDMPSSNHKPRVLLVSAVIPIERSGGGCLAMRRHFILNDDFEIAVAAARGDIPAELPHYHVRLDRLSERMRRTSLLRTVMNVEYLRNWQFLPGKLVDFARDFRPDLIFSVVDDWHMGLAWQLSRKLRVPLAINFQDLFALSLFQPQTVRPIPRIRSFLLNRYRFLNANAERVFHTSEGMREWFAPRCRGDVLYPVPDLTPRHSVPTSLSDSRGRLKLVYTGNCSGAYGQMLLRLARRLCGNPQIILHIYSRATDWPADVESEMKAAGVLQGFLPFSELRDRLAMADAFLSVMSFTPEQYSFMTTSFTTKCGDYVPWGKPMFIWGPEYSTPCRFVKKYGAGLAVEQDDPQALIDAVTHAANDQKVWQQLADGALAAAQGPLNACGIHGLLKNQLLSAL